MAQRLPLVRMIAALFISVLIALSGSAGFAQSGAEQQHGDWQTSCETPPGAQFPQCGIIQRVTAIDQPDVAINVIILKLADLETLMLRVYAPLGVLLPNGLGLNVDGEDFGRVGFVRCLPNGCITEVNIDQELFDKMSTGDQAIFIIFKTPEEGIGIPVSLNGFSEGIASLP